MAILIYEGAGGGNTEGKKKGKKKMEQPAAKGGFKNAKESFERPPKRAELWNA